tara:strand:+ start:122 stop:391 length:270 start_codon:yes stop_codon:yes gene_type:complete
VDNEYWHIKSDSVILSIGDIIVDVATGQIGVLLTREHRVTFEDDDLYFWYVNWSHDIKDPRVAPNPLWMEEQGLKMSIYVGFYDLHAAK